jgi:hypothetical protein
MVTIRVAISPAVIQRARVSMISVWGVIGKAGT